MNLTKSIAAFMRRFRSRCRQVSQRSRRAVAAAEFALTLPVWMTMLLGAADGTYFMLVNEKSDRIAYTVTDIVTQYQVVTRANLNDIILAATQEMQPFPFGT